MMKIAFIGAGSIVLGMNLLTNILTFPSLEKNFSILYYKNLSALLVLKVKNLRYL